MKAHKQLIALVALLIVAAAAYVGWIALRAHRNLVTLDVRNMEVREVVKKIERQTWENIYVDKNVQSKVTLRVRSMPLEEVLRIIGDQTMSRSLVLYPLYSTSKSLASFKEAVRGEADPAQSGWSNLGAAFGGFRGGLMLAGFGGPGGAGGNPFGAMADNSMQRVSLNIVSKDLSFAVAAFGRFAQARVVPEDSTRGIVTLSLNKVPVSSAVTQLAAKVHRKSEKVYVLRGGGPGPGRPGGPGPQFAARNGNPRDGAEFGRRGPGDRPDQTAEQRDEMRQQREALEQELKQALPSEDRQKIEQAEAQRAQQMRDMASLSPEQRRERMGNGPGGGAAMARMNRDRVINSTPEQRAEMTRREREMRQRFAQQGNQPAPGR